MTAAETAALLVKAYGELRQAELVLHSLAAALSGENCDETAALRIVDSAAFEDALFKVCHCCSSIHNCVLTITFTLPVRVGASHLSYCA
jgi:hypothetical protein